MAVGLSAVNLANKWLDMLSATAFTAPAGAFIKLHIVSVGDNHGPRGTSAWLRGQAQTFQPKDTLRHANTHWLAVRRNSQQCAGTFGVG